MAIEFDGKGNVTSTTEDGAIAVKFYSMQKQIDDLQETIKILRERERTFNDLCKQYREEVERLEKQQQNVINYVKKNISYYYDEDLDKHITQYEVDGIDILKIVGEIE